MFAKTLVTFVVAILVAADMPGALAEPTSQLGDPARVGRNSSRSIEVVRVAGDPAADRMLVGRLGYDGVLRLSVVGTDPGRPVVRQQLSWGGGRTWIESFDVAFDGTRFLVVFRTEYHDVYAYFLDFDGTRSATNQAGYIGEGSYGGGVSVAWNQGRQEYLVVYESGKWCCTIHAVTVPEAGLPQTGKIPPSQTIASDAYGPTVASNGSGFLVTWVVPGLDGDWIRARAMASGGTFGDDTLIAQTGTYDPQPDIASDGRRYLVVWENDSAYVAGDLAATIVSETGVPVIQGGRALYRSDHDESTSSVTWNGLNYVVSWIRDDGVSRTVLAARVSGDGAVVDATPATVASASCGCSAVAADSKGRVGIAYAGPKTDKSDYPILMRLFHDPARGAAPVPAANEAPTPSFTVACWGYGCHFRDTSADPDGMIESRVWEFADGRTATWDALYHRFAATGTHNVRLTVTDYEGGTASVTQAVTVTADDPDPATPTLTSGETFSDTNGAAGTWHFYKINVPSGRSQLKVELQGPECSALLAACDPDLNLYVGTSKSLDSYSRKCADIGIGSSATCTLRDPHDGWYYIGVNVASATTTKTFTVKATY